MQIEAKDITNLVPEKKYIHDSSAVYMPFEDEGFNKAIDLLSKKKLEVVIDREKLAKTLYNKLAGDTIGWENEPKEIKDYWYGGADAIIQSAKTDNSLVTIRSVE